MKFVLRIAFLLVFSFLLLPSAHAQSDRGGISGKVTDNTGAVLPNALVTLRNEATGVTQTAPSNGSGDYVFQLLNPGSYSVAVTAQGFKTAERTHVVVDVGQVNEQNVTLAVGSTKETVEVTTGVQQLQTESGTLGLIVEQRSIQELPLVYGKPLLPRDPLPRSACLRRQPQYPRLRLQHRHGLGERLRPQLHRVPPRRRAR